MSLAPAKPPPDLKAVLLVGQALDPESAMGLSWSAETPRVLSAQGEQEALRIAGSEALDVIVIDPDDAPWGLEFAAALRRAADFQSRQAPVLLVVGTASVAIVSRARDCGVSHVIAKPITPEKIWAGLNRIRQKPRAFLALDCYCGPDRRFANLGPPAGMAGRRQEDLPPEIGAATAPNLSQDEIDSVFKPQRVKL